MSVSYGIIYTVSASDKIEAKEPQWYTWTIIHLII